MCDWPGLQTELKTFGGKFHIIVLLLSSLYSKIEVGVFEIKEAGDSKFPAS